MRLARSLHGRAAAAAPSPAPPGALLSWAFVVFPARGSGLAASCLVIQDVTILVTAVTDLLTGMAMKPLVTDALLEKAVSEKDSAAAPSRAVGATAWNLGWKQDPELLENEAEVVCMGVSPCACLCTLCVRCVSWGLGDVGPRSRGLTYHWWIRLRHTAVWTVSEGPAGRPWSLWPCPACEGDRAEPPGRAAL